jgi:hypothetical protein
MRKITVYFLISIFLFTHVAVAQEKVDEQVVARIKAEGMEHSQVMDTLGYITDVFGPRLTNSPNLRNAQEWVGGKMTSWGFENVHLEPWGEFGKGWAVERFSAEMLEPTYDRLVAYPLAWSPGISGTLTGNPVVVSITRKTADADFAKYHGKLKGAIVLTGVFDFNKPETRFEARAKRFTETELKTAAKEKDPAKEGINGGVTTTLEAENKEFDEGLNWARQRYKFYKDEGVSAVLVPSGRPNGVLSVQGFYDADPKNNPPAFVIAREQYARMVRLSNRNIPVKVELNLQTRFYDQPTGRNVVGEITGSDPKLKDEVILLGGHFDSWHSATGATDNGAGCVAVLEALRILKAIGAQPRRTIRVALWDGEEQAYYGSVGYVKKHYGDPDTKQPGAEHDKLSAYYNLDNGTGRIRGVFLQGNEAVRPIFEKYLKPFNSMGASTLSILNTGGTDHMVFDALGLPGFQFIQDPMDYDTLTHHTNLDVLEAVNEEDMKVNSVIIAAFAYQTAMRDEKLPRIKKK